MYIMYLFITLFCLPRNELLLGIIRNKRLKS